MNKYVYHFKPTKLFGTRLFPLNELNLVNPQAYENEIKKYSGREHLLQKKIPILDCLWNDVLHLSPINPQVILDTWRKEGLGRYLNSKASIVVFKIPTDLLSDSKTVYFQYSNLEYGSFDPSHERFTPFIGSEYQEQTAIEPIQVQAWRNDALKKRKLFWFSHTRHVLVRDQIEISSCEEMVCD